VTEKGRRLLVSAALVAVAVVWGSTFVMVKGAVAAYPVYSFLGLRFAIACLAFAVIFPSTFRRFGPRTVRDGMFAGVFLTLGYVFQTLGLTLTSPSKAAFITGMFVVITPFLQAVVLRRVPRWTAWLGVAPAVAWRAAGTWETRSFWRAPRRIRVTSSCSDRSAGATTLCRSRSSSSRSRR
jgi:drug/metabolite transporter (DMT)-like permease